MERVPLIDCEDNYLISRLEISRLIHSIAPQFLPTSDILETLNSDFTLDFIECRNQYIYTLMSAFVSGIKDSIYDGMRRFLFIWNHVDPFEYDLLEYLYPQELWPQLDYRVADYCHFYDNVLSRLAPYLSFCSRDKLAECTPYLLSLFSLCAEVDFIRSAPGSSIILQHFPKWTHEYVFWPAHTVDFGWFMGSSGFMTMIDKWRRVFVNLRAVHVEIKTMNILVSPLLSTVMHTGMDIIWCASILACNHYKVEIEAVYRAKFFGTGRAFFNHMFASLLYVLRFSDMEGCCLLRSIRVIYEALAAFSDIRVKGSRFTFTPLCYRIPFWNTGVSNHRYVTPLSMERIADMAIRGVSIPEEFVLGQDTYHVLTFRLPAIISLRSSAKRNLIAEGVEPNPGPIGFNIDILSF